MLRTQVVNKSETPVSPSTHFLKNYGEGGPCPRHEDIGGVEVYLHSFLTSALGGGERLTSRTDRFTPLGENPSTRRIGGGWQDPRAGLDVL